MRGCGFGDCLPASDVALARSARSFFALDHRPDAREVAQLLAPFAPHLSLATFQLWSLIGDPA
jgi:3-methyladenine DNA glycosylase/8-oxoguanine DNA glycosylase